MKPSSLSVGEVVVVALGAVALAVATIVWSGGALAARLTGTPFDGSLADAFIAAPGLWNNRNNPPSAWPADAGLRDVSPAAYWACTAVVTLLVIGATAVGLRIYHRGWIGTELRHRLGVDARARFARLRDLKPLIVDGPEPGRFILGRFRRHLIASEDSSRSAHRWAPWRSRSHAGHRGAIALVGPSGSGKTTAVVSGVLEWDGPAVLSSVKDDLVRVTGGYRAKVGEIAVFDPTKLTGFGNAVWSPVRQAGTPLGAQRAARALVEAAPKAPSTTGDVDFWMSQAEILLASLMFIAHHTGGDMGVIAEWVLNQDRPGDDGPGEVMSALDQIMELGTPDAQRDAEHATRQLDALWNDEAGTRSSVYATARGAVWPWAEPGVAASSRGDSVDLDWLLDGPNTLYLCAPVDDQERLVPAFGGLLNDIIRHVYLRVAACGRPIDPPLLVVIDEAGNTPLRSLPQYASTLAGMGVLLVTVWQSLAQIEKAYGRHTGTILTNHPSKVFYGGLCDLDSQHYVTGILGDEEVKTNSRSDDTHGGRGSTQTSTARAPLAAPHVQRQMRRGDALLIHGTLPPAHIRTRPYYREWALRRRARIPVPSIELLKESSVTEVTIDGTHQTALPTIRTT